MQPEDTALLTQLLTGERLLSLAVMVDDAPYVGLLPFALSADADALLVHASALAKHTKGLRHGAPYSALIHAPDSPDSDPLQIPRITLTGSVKLLAKDGTEYPAARDAYLAKFPTSTQTFLLADFNLYVLAMEQARFVAGFGKTYNLTAARIRETVAG